MLQAWLSTLSFRCDAPFDRSIAVEQGTNCRIWSAYSPDSYRDEDHQHHHSPLTI
jgi:hypothetical protein